MSDNLCVIVPSRGRPANVAALRAAWADTDTTAHLVVAVDRDDPALAAYLALGADMRVGPRLRMAPTLNKYAAEYAGRYKYIGFMGDDHRPRTEHWDWRVIEALAEQRVGLAYGDDGFQGANLPTAVFMTSNIVDALGYMAPPGLIHLYLDNFWLDFGWAIGGIRYMPEISIEHMHPIAGKAANDAGYVEVNDPQMYAHDLAVYKEYRESGQFSIDVEKVKAL